MFVYSCVHVCIYIYTHIHGWTSSSPNILYHICREREMYVVSLPLRVITVAVSLVAIATVVARLSVARVGKHMHLWWNVHCEMCMFNSYSLWLKYEMCKSSICVDGWYTMHYCFGRPRQRKCCPWSRHLPARPRCGQAPDGDDSWYDSDGYGMIISHVSF